MFASPAAAQGIADLSSQADTAIRHAKLMHAAQQFEAVMLGELMKPLAKSSTLDDADEGGPNAMQGYGVEAMAGALAKSGALGFANRIVAAVEKQSARISSQKVSDASKVSPDLVDKPMEGK
jgi:flagellar protein FlgJ